MAPESLLGLKWKTGQAMVSAIILSVIRLNNTNINLQFYMHAFYFSLSWRSQRILYF